MRTAGISFIRMQRMIYAAIVGLFMLAASTSSFGQKAAQPVLGHRNVEILKIDNLEFKDLNKNHKLDKYEDWRLPVDVRIKDLISKMTIEEKVGFMLISTTRLAGDQSFQANGPKSEITSGFNEEDLVH